MATFLNPKGHKTALGQFPEVSVDDSWPDAGLIARPNDAIGEAIISYARLNSGHPDFPPSPWDPRRGDIYLPDLDQPRAATDPVPRYRTREATFIGPNLFNAGKIVAYPGWPANPHTLEAQNEGAKLVLSYMERHGAGHRLAGLPHDAGVLNLPNPATTFGSPLSPRLSRSIGELQPV